MFLFSGISLACDRILLIHGSKLGAGWWAARIAHRIFSKEFVVLFGIFVPAFDLGLLDFGFWLLALGNGGFA